MKKIMKWLDSMNIKYDLNNGYIVIILEKDCIWVNGFGEPMKYDKKISIYKNPYSEYVIYEVTGYNLHKKLFQGSRADNAIYTLDKRLL